MTIEKGKRKRKGRSYIEIRRTRIQICWRYQMRILLLFASYFWKFQFLFTNTIPPIPLPPRRVRFRHRLENICDFNACVVDVLEWTFDLNKEIWAMRNRYYASHLAHSFHRLHCCASRLYTLLVVNLCHHNLVIFMLMVFTQRYSHSNRIYVFCWSVDNLCWIPFSNRLIFPFVSSSQSLARASYPPILEHSPHILRIQPNFVLCETFINNVHDNRCLCSK